MRRDRFELWLADTVIKILASGALRPPGPDFEEEAGMKEDHDTMEGPANAPLPEETRAASCHDHGGAPDDLDYEPFTDEEVDRIYDRVLTKLAADDEEETDESDPPCAPAAEYMRHREGTASHAEADADERPHESESYEPFTEEEVDRIYSRVLAKLAKEEGEEEELAVNHPFTPPSAGGPSVAAAHEPDYVAFGSSWRGLSERGYRPMKLLGSGAFSEVWSAEAADGSPVALKVIRSPAGREGGQRESRALELVKNLRHPFLLPLHSFWWTEDRLFVVTELADGSLRDRLHECRDEGRSGIAASELLSYFHDAAEALDYLHCHEVIHGDVKPENLLLLGAHLKVADFGLAAVFEGHCPPADLASRSPAYAAPEVWGGTFGRRSDQYSLACAYAELCRGLHSAEREVVERALHRDPARRFPSCVEFVRALKDSARAASRRVAERRCPPSSHPEAELTGSSPVKVRPTLVVGIGGIGALICQSVQALTRELLGDAPPFMKFLVLDTDVPEAGGPGRERLADTEFVNLFRHLDSYDLHRRLDLASETRSRLARHGPRNRDATSIAHGYYSSGRAARSAFLEFLERAVRPAAVRLFDSLNNPYLAQQTEALEPRSQFLLEEGRSPRVHIAASLCGGTSSGLLLDLTYSLRSWSNEVFCEPAEIVSHLVLPEAFPTHSPEHRDRLWAAAYTTLEQIELLMDGRRASNRVQRPEGVSTLDGTTVPFDYCYVLGGSSITAGDRRELVETVGRMIRAMAVEPAGQAIFSDPASKYLDVPSPVGAASERSRCFGSYGLGYRSLSALSGMRPRTHRAARAQEGTAPHPAVVAAELRALVSEAISERLNRGEGTWHSPLMGWLFTALSELGYEAAPGFSWRRHGASSEPRDVVIIQQSKDSCLLPPLEWGFGSTILIRLYPS
jgi:serine/threonine protein kinase